MNAITLAGSAPGAPIIPMYPWKGGDTLYASALNAAIANAPGTAGADTPFDFGAKGDGVTDDTAAFQAMFAQFASAGSGSVYINGSFYLASAVTVPDSVEIYGNFTPIALQYNWGTTFFQAGGSKLILGAGMTLGRACILRNVMIIANNLPRTNPTTLTAANSLIAQMASNGNGITLGKDACLLDSIQVLGFSTGIYGVNGGGSYGCDRQMLRNIHVDCINGIWLQGGGDTTRIQGAQIVPFLTHGVTGASAAYIRNGTGVYLLNIACDTEISQVTTYGWQTGFMADGCSANYVQCWGDGVGNLGSAGFATINAGYSVKLVGCTSVAQQFAVHHSVTTGGVIELIGCSLGGGGAGGNTPGTGMTIAVYADGHGPVRCSHSYFGGGNAAAFWLGPNTGRSIIIGNTFDDAHSNWDHVWNVDPAVLPLLTKHSNRVINTTRGFTEQLTGSPVYGGVAVYDQMPQGFDGTPIGVNMPAAGSFTSLNASGNIVSTGGYGSFPAVWSSGVVTTTSTTSTSASYRITLTGAGTDQNMWDQYVNGNTFEFRAVNDAGAAANPWLTVTRAGYVPQVITLAAPTITLSGAVTATSINSTSVGNTTPSTGAFTTLFASSTVSGAGFTSLLSPYALSTSVPVASSTTPVMDGTAAVGTGTTWARADHVHASDTSRAPVASPTLTGNITLSGPTTVSGTYLSVSQSFYAQSNFFLQGSGNPADQNSWNFVTQSGGGALGGFAYNDALTASTQWLGITRTGYVPQVITLTAPNIVHVGATVISASGGPTIRAGTGAATGTQPSGSLWLRTDGSAGARLYVSAGAGTWAAVAGV